MNKTKTIWDKSMSSRKKIFFNSKHDRSMRRWSERAEWYSDMPLDIYAMCGLTDFVHILFPSKKYRHIHDGPSPRLRGLLGAQHNGGRGPRKARAEEP